MSEIGQSLAPAKGCHKSAIRNFYTTPGLVRLVYRYTPASLHRLASLQGWWRQWVAGCPETTERWQEGFLWNHHHHHLPRVILTHGRVCFLDKHSLWHNWSLLQLMHSSICLWRFFYRGIAPIKWQDINKHFFLGRWVKVKEEHLSHCEVWCTWAINRHTQEGKLLWKIQHSCGL